MTASANYRTESRAIRMAARDYLARLRAARLGDPAELPAPPAPPAPAAGEIAMLQASAAAGDLARDARDAAGPGSAGPDTGPADEPSASPEAGAPGGPDDPPSAQDDAAPAPEAGSPPDPEPERSPLLDLPGAGPGLVWLLQTAGIRNLADLAACGEADLRARLGPVGELVNLGGWIAHAGARAPRDGADRPLAGNDPFTPH